MSQTNLTDLPPEVIQNMGEYLDFDDVANIRKSSSYIDNCLSDDYFWKNFARSHIPPTFPPYKPDISKFDWEINVTKYLKERKYWDMSNVGIQISKPTSLQRYTVTKILISKDARYCATNGFDRNLSLWDVRTLFSDSRRLPVACTAATPTGFITNIQQNDVNIYSASYNKVEVWDLDTSLKLVKTINLEELVESMTTLDSNTICMGLNNGVLAFADTRVPETYEHVYAHKQRVLSIVARDNTTISCSKDFNISIVDRRRPRPILRQVPYLPAFGSPLKLSLCEYYLLVGSNTGEVHFFDANSFAHKGQHKVIDNFYYKYAGLCHNMGSIVVANVGGSIMHYTLTNPPKLNRWFTDIHPICLDYSNQIIAVGTPRSVFVMTHSENNLFN